MNRQCPIYLCCRPRFYVVVTFLVIPSKDEHCDYSGTSAQTNKFVTFLEHTMKMVGLPGWPMQVRGAGERSGAFIFRYWLKPVLFHTVCVQY